VRRAFQQATADTLLPVFERVVSTEGTARRAIVDGLRIAGKTGTARIAEDGRYIAAYRATFVGLFPADRPEVALIVVMDRPSNGYFGGTVAAPVFGRIAERWAGVQPALAGRTGEHAEPRAPAAAPVPDIRGLPQGIAAARVRAAGLQAIPEGRRPDDAWRPVAAQRPLAGDSAGVRQPVRFAAARYDTPVTAMPNLTGLSARQAAVWLARLGVTPRLECTGVITRQTPAPGSDLPAEAILSCR
jgi:cell division protein FtsI (penicillin-binding protein 3)